MLRVLVAGSGAFLLTFGLTPFVKWLAERVGAFDHPHEMRRVHQTTMPRLGGAAIFVALALVAGVQAWIDPTLLPTWQPLLVVIPVFVLGVLDDLRGVSERWKLFVPAGSAVVLYGLGWRVSAVSILPGLTVDLPAWLGFGLTVLWLVGMTNAFNLIDGLDGLALGVAALSTAALLVSALLTGQPAMALLAAILLGALLGFGPYNFYPARIFLGDAGSLLLGFVLAALALRSTATENGTISLVPPVLLGLPLTEAAVTLLRRWLAKQPLLPGDRGHFHHKLLELGYSQRQAVLRLYVVGLMFAAGGLLLLQAGLWVTLGVLILLSLGILYGVRALPYEEFRRGKAGVAGSIRPQS